VFFHDSAFFVLCSAKKYSSSNDNCNYNNKTLIITAAATTTTAVTAFTFTVDKASDVGVAVVLLLVFGQCLVLIFSVTSAILRLFVVLLSA
jgi:hypothetical protein